LVYNAWLQANREAGKMLDFIVDVTRNRASCHLGRRQISGQSASLNSSYKKVAPIMAQAIANEISGLVP
jgi:hypothetical protein